MTEHPLASPGPVTRGKGRDGLTQGGRIPTSCEDPLQAHIVNHLILLGDQPVDNRQRVPTSQKKPRVL